MLKFRLLRLVIGLPLFILGMGVATVHSGSVFWYVSGCIISLIGGYIVSRTVNYSLTGIGFALVGVPVFFLSMLPDAYCWSGFEPLTIFAIRLFASLLGSLMTFAVMNDES